MREMIEEEMGSGHCSLWTRAACGRKGWCNMLTALQGPRCESALLSPMTDVVKAF